jgi:hypothetical protein
MYLENLLKFNFKFHENSFTRCYKRTDGQRHDIAKIIRAFAANNGINTQFALHIYNYSLRARRKKK